MPAAWGQDLSDEPLLPQTISSEDIEMRGQYVSQSQLADGTMVLQFNGRFHLSYGMRELSARNAVVWIERPQDEAGRAYFAVSVFLSGQAMLEEAGGTIVQDAVLYVSNLKTYGQIIKYQDAHVVEDLAKLPLYQTATRARELIREQVPAATVAGAEGIPDVVRPGDLEAMRAAKPPSVIRYRLRSLRPAETPEGERVMVASGGVYFSRAGGPEDPLIEITADNAVVFLGGDVDEETTTVEPVEDEPAPTGAEDLGAELQQRLRAVYLEGDVRISMGDRFIRSPRLYYDFEMQRAVILDAVFRAELPERGVPLYVRAEEMRQISARRFSAVDVSISTSEFAVPHYHVGAEKVDIYDRTPRDRQGAPLTELQGTFALENATYNIEDVPVFWWPYAQGDLEQSETLLRGLSTGWDSEYGARLETEWYLFNLLGAAPPEGYDATLRLDYLSKRGAGVGIDADYERKNYFGLMRSYYIHDTGEDDLGPLRQAENQPDTDNRGRFLWRHKQYLPNDWEANFELSYISDPHYLETFERAEFWEGKEQETAVYLKRVRGNEAITFLANWRLLDFLTQTEHLPDVTYRRLGDTFLDPLVLYHESRMGYVRYRVDEREFFEYSRNRNDKSSDMTFRADVRQEAELPLKLGWLNVVPFATLRGTYWDGQPLDDGGLWRGLGIYGVRGSTSFARVYDDAHSELLAINRLRHIVTPHFATWWAHSNTRSDQITPFDEGVETVDDFYGSLIGVRQVWQTKRGAGELERSVDLLTLNLEAGFFGDAQPGEETVGYVNAMRPEDSRTQNYVAGEMIYRLSDTTSVLYDFNFDLEEMDLDRHNLSLAVERSPRLAYIVGYRNANDIGYSMVGGGLNYRLNEKHTVATRVWYDIYERELGELAVAYVRKLPRWYVAVTVQFDEVFDDTSIMLSVWPEGLPEWTLGSRRFTGLGTSTGIRP